MQFLRMPVQALRQLHAEDPIFVRAGDAAKVAYASDELSVAIRCFLSKYRSVKLSSDKWRRLAGQCTPRQCRAIATVLDSMNLGESSESSECEFLPPAFRTSTTTPKGSSDRKALTMRPWQDDAAESPGDADDFHTPKASEVRLVSRTPFCSSWSVTHRQPWQLHCGISPRELKFQFDQAETSA